MERNVKISFELELDPSETGMFTEHARIAQERSDEKAGKVIDAILPLVQAMIPVMVGSLTRSSPTPRPSSSPYPRPVDDGDEDNVHPFPGGSGDDYNDDGTDEDLSAEDQLLLRHFLDHAADMSDAAQAAVTARDPGRAGAIILPMTSFPYHLLPAFSEAVREASEGCNIDGVEFRVYSTSNLENLVEGWSSEGKLPYTACCHIDPAG